MKRFFKGGLQTAATALAVTVLCLSMARCTTVDDTLGQNYIPDYQLMKLRIDTLGSMKSYIAVNDSLPSSNQSIIYIGSRVDPKLGRTWASAMTDFYPPTTSFNDGEFFGDDPIIDSLMLTFYIYDVFGKTGVEQKFNVYALTDSLQRDSVYWYNTPLAEKVDRTKPLFSFTLTDEESGSIFYEKIALTTEGEAFVQKIVETSDEIFETPYPEFLQRFYGIYIEPDESNPEDAALYEIYMRLTTDSDYYTYGSNFVVCTHNMDPESPAEVDTTLYIPFYFDNYTYPLLSVNNVVRTYTAEIENSISDPYSEAAGAMKPLATTYVQSLGGLATYIEFGDELLADIEALKKVGDKEFSDIIINQARLYIPMTDPTTENMNMAPTRLGMYSTYGQTILNGSALGGYPVLFAGMPIPLFDYAYYTENAGTYYEQEEISYDGYLYRTPGYYKMDITSHLMYLVHQNEDTPKGIWVGPDILYRSDMFNEVELRGAEGSGNTENPIKLVLTYTLVK